jgi:hypothetical protein
MRTANEPVRGRRTWAGAWMFLLMGAVGVAGWSITFVGRYFLWLEYYDRYGEQALLVCSFGVAMTTTGAAVVLLLRQGRRGQALNLESRHGDR